mgnify:FL=1
MPQAISKLTDKAWAELFAVNLSAAKVKRPVGEGWKTRDEIGQMIGKKKSGTNEFLRFHIKAGNVECFSGVEPTEGGILRPKHLYRPVACAPKAAAAAKKAS